MQGLRLSRRLVGLKTRTGMIHEVDPKRSFAPRWPASLNGKYASGTSPAIQPKVPPCGTESAREMCGRARKHRRGKQDLRARHEIMPSRRIDTRSDNPAPGSGSPISSVPCQGSSSSPFADDQRSGAVYLYAFAHRGDARTVLIAGATGAGGRRTTGGGESPLNHHFAHPACVRCRTERDMRSAYKKARGGSAPF